jgi:hypothetical protein
MTQIPRDRGALSGLHALRDVLDTAQMLVADLEAATDPLDARLGQLFARMPAADREPILGILERELERRLLAESLAASITGIRLRPNPNARICFRIIDREPELNRDEMIRGTVRAMSMYHKAFAIIREDWDATALEALRALDPTARANVARFGRELAALVERCEGVPEASLARNAR